LRLAKRDRQRETGKERPAKRDRQRETGKEILPRDLPLPAAPESIVPIADATN
jgi:hypothetical protein